MKTENPKSENKKPKTKIAVATATVLIPLDHLMKSKEIPNRAIDKAHVTALAESILANGLDTPLTVYSGTPNNPDGQMKLKTGKHVRGSFVVAGFHRRLALKELADTHAERFAKMFPNGIPCNYVTGDLSDCVSAQLRENLDRLEPSASDILPHLVRLKDEFKLSGKEIAKRIGKSEAWVSQIMKVKENLGKEGVEAIADGKLSMRDAREASKQVEKKGKTPKEALEGAKTKAAKKKAGGADRKSVARLSVKKIKTRYDALPALKPMAKIAVLENILSYLVEETDELCEELQGAGEEADATEKSVKKKAAK